MAEPAAVSAAAASVSAALGLPPTALRHFRDRLDVRGDPCTFCNDLAKNVLQRLQELYMGRCYRAVYVVDIYAVDPDTAAQPCIFMYDSPEGLAQVCVGYTARVRDFAVGDVVTGVRVLQADSAYVFGERPGAVRAVIQGGAAAVLRVGQRAPMRITHAEYPHGALPVVVGELLSARGAGAATFEVSVAAAGRLSAAAVAALGPLLARVLAASTWLAGPEAAASPLAGRLAQFAALFDFPAPPGATFDLLTVASGFTPVPAGLWRSAGSRPVAAAVAVSPDVVLSGDAPRLLSPEAVVAELLVEHARTMETLRALAVDYLDEADFAAHTNLWTALRR